KGLSSAITHPHQTSRPTSQPTNKPPQELAPTKATNTDSTSPVAGSGVEDPRRGSDSPTSHRTREFGSPGAGVPLPSPRPARETAMQTLQRRSKPITCTHFFRENTRAKSTL